MGTKIESSVSPHHGNQASESYNNCLKGEAAFITLERMPDNTKKELFKNLTPTERKLPYKRRAASAQFRDLLFNSEYFSQNGEQIINEAQETLNKRPHPVYQGYSREIVKAYLSVTATDSQPAEFCRAGTAEATAITAQTALALANINHMVLQAQRKNALALENNESPITVTQKYESITTILGLFPYIPKNLSRDFAIQFQILNYGLDILCSQNNAILNQNDAILNKLYESNTALRTIKDELKQERINSSSVAKPPPIGL
jgi:hypothetical protein